VERSVKSSRAAAKSPGHVRIASYLLLWEQFRDVKSVERRLGPAANVEVVVLHRLLENKRERTTAPGQRNA
jgi:hypothetical protein